MVRTQIFCSRLSQIRKDNEAEQSANQMSMLHAFALPFSHTSEPKGELVEGPPRSLSRLSILSFRSSLPVKQLRRNGLGFGYAARECENNLI